MNKATVYGDSRSEWETPQWLYERLNAWFGFTLDVAATAQNSKCPAFYTAEENGLKHSWIGETCFMNPPYGRGVIDQWVRKADQEAEENSVTTVGILPASLETEWFRGYVQGYPFMIWPHRIQFVDPTGQDRKRPANATVIAVFSPNSHIPGIRFHGEPWYTPEF